MNVQLSKIHSENIGRELKSELRDDAARRKAATVSNEPPDSDEQRRAYDAVRAARYRRPDTGRKYVERLEAENTLKSLGSSFRRDAVAVTNNPVETLRSRIAFLESRGPRLLAWTRS